MLRAELRATPPDPAYSVPFSEYEFRLPLVSMEAEARARLVDQLKAAGVEGLS